MPSRPTSSLAPLVALLVPFAAACTTTPTTTNNTTDDASGLSPALLIRPKEFMGDVPCSAAPGAMRSYVATLIDHLRTTNADTGQIVEERFTFPSSLPTSCGEGVRFDDAVAGHFYSLEIEGYEDFAADIGPDGWARSDGTVNYAKLRSGSRHMVDKKDKPVTPRWTTSCGADELERTVAAASGTTLIQGCDLLEDNGTPGPTVVEIDPKDALGSATACAGDGAPGQPTVATFDVQSLDGLGTTKGVACAKDVPALTYSGAALADGKKLTFYIGGHAAKDGPVTFGSTCSAVVREGLTVTAECSPLTDVGTLALDFGAVLAKEGYACGGDFATFHAVLTLGDQTVTYDSVPCAGTAVFSLLPASPFVLDATVVAKNGTQLFAATCEGTVVPAQKTVVTGCTIQ